jgi:hypothetical protein
MTAARAGSFTIWLVIVLSSVGVGGYALFHVFTGFLYLPLNNPMFEPWGLRTHITASGVAMILGALQFSKTLRGKAPSLHRWTVRAYVLACVIGALTGGVIALSSTAGLIAGAGSFMLAVLWAPFTLLALVSVMRRNFVAHERWMIRSFGLTFAAVTLRIQIPIAGPLGEAGVIPTDFDWSYQYIAWLAWVPNLIVAELFIATLLKSKPAKASASAALA